MEAIIQVFQDEYHLRTLDLLLQATGQLSPQVNIKQIITTFIDRLAAFAMRERENTETDEVKGDKEDKEDSKKSAETKTNGIPSDIKLFEIFWEQVSGIIKNRTELSLQDVVSLLMSLMNLSLSCYPVQLDYVEKIWTFAKEHFATVKG